MQQVSNEYLNAIHAIRGLMAYEADMFEGIEINPELELLATDYLVFSAQEKEGAKIEQIDIENMSKRTRSLVKGAFQVALAYKDVKKLIDQVSNGERFNDEDSQELFDAVTDAIATEVFNDQGIRK